MWVCVCHCRKPGGLQTYETFEEGIANIGIPLDVFLLCFAVLMIFCVLNFWTSLLGIMGIYQGEGMWL